MTKKIIAIDTQTTYGQKTGFGFYVNNLVEALAEEAGPYKYVGITPGVDRDLSSLSRFAWDQFQFPLRAMRSHAELLHQPAFSAPVLYPGKVVVTVHDLIARLFGSDIRFGSRQYFARWMPFSYRRADHIIAVSEHTKKDIVRELHIPEEKITVIYLAAGSEFSPDRDPKVVKAVTDKYGVTQPYFVHIGTINPRKNLEFLVRAFSGVVKRYPDVSLVITGKKGWYYDGLFRAVTDLGLEKKVIFTGYVADEEKPLLYNGALACVFPSVYEGFGLPPLEAMASGTPVVASKSSSVPEIVGGAGILADPADSAAWVTAMEAVLTKPKLRAELTTKGLHQASQFTWKKTARETIKIYEQVLRTGERS